MIEKILGMFTNNIGTKLISIIIVLWFVVLGSRNVEVTKEVPLEIITSSEIVPSNDIPEKIAFRLSGPKAFLRAVLDRREDPIRVNLAGSKPGLVTYRFFSDNIRVPIGVKVLSINPTAILVKLEHVKRRDVPVKLELRGMIPEGFRVLRTEVKPQVVRIKGPESRVDSITEIATIPLDISGIRQNTDREVSLDISRYGLQMEGALPHAVILVEPESANFRIKNVEVRVLTNHKSTLSDKTVTVFVRAAQDDLKRLDRKHVYATVDLRGKPKGRYSETVKITLPENIGFVKAVPDKVSLKLH